MGNIIACNLGSYRGQFSTQEMYRHLAEIGLTNVEVGTPEPDLIEAVLKELADYGLAATTIMAHHDVKDEGLKTKLIRQVKNQAQSELNKTDWYVVRKADTDEAIPSAVATHRAAVRSKQASMETSITNASDTAALETLYTYTEQEDGSTTRPLGEIPVKEF